MNTYSTSLNVPACRKREYFFSNDLMPAMGFEPAEFCDYINEHDIRYYNEDRAHFYPHDRKFTNYDFDDICFHRNTVIKIAPEFPELQALLRSSKIATALQAGRDSHVIELENELAQARQENERLKQEVERLKVESRPNVPQAMDCAACHAEASPASAWVKDVECAVSFACTLMQAGERGSTDYHKAEWKTRRGAPRKRAFEAFRRALPDHLKEADPKKK